MKLPTSFLHRQLYLIMTFIKMVESKAYKVIATIVSPFLLSINANKIMNPHLMAKKGKRG